jgi:hypothetical protein
LLRLLGKLVLRDAHAAQARLLKSAKAGLIMATTTLFATAGPIEPMLEHEIRIRAYELYERRGAREGHALDDWLEAEYEVLRQRGIVGLAVPSKQVVYR